MTEKARELLERSLLYVDVLCPTYEEIRAYLAVPRPEFVRLSEDEVTEILTSAYDIYEAICAVENRLVKKNSINRSDPDSIDLQSRCRGDKL